VELTPLRREVEALMPWEKVLVSPDAAAAPTSEAMLDWSAAFSASVFSTTSTWTVKVVVGEVEGVSNGSADRHVVHADSVLLGGKLDLGDLVAGVFGQRG
jgi:hypothetical protein